jgi:hypothetical protein
MSLPALPKTHDPAHFAEWLKASATSLPHSKDDAEALMTAIEHASTPARPDDIGTQVMIIIAQYFVGDQPKVIRDATIAIWMEHLAPFPLWAIKRAVSWWLGPDNPAPRRARRPQPGDLAEACRDQIAAIDRARQHVAWWEKYQGAYPSFITATMGHVTA